MTVTKPVSLLSLWSVPVALGEIPSPGRDPRGPSPAGPGGRAGGGSKSRLFLRLCWGYFCRLGTRGLLWNNNANLMLL